MTTQTEKVLKLSDAQGFISPRDVEAIGVPRAVLTRLVRLGQLVRIGRGLYSKPDRSTSKHTTLAELSKIQPQFLYCLISALQFHGISTQLAHEVWVAIPNKAHHPVTHTYSLRIVRFSGRALNEGIEEHLVDGVTIRVTNIGKTVADCFKYRNKIGLDVAIEALHDAWNQRRVTMDELWHYSSVCRVSNVIRPYLEGLGSSI